VCRCFVFPGNRPQRNAARIPRRRSRAVDRPRQVPLSPARRRPCRYPLRASEVLGVHRVTGSRSRSGRQALLSARGVAQRSSVSRVRRRSRSARVAASLRRSRAVVGRPFSEASRSVRTWSSSSAATRARSCAIVARAAASSSSISSMRSRGSVSGSPARKAAAVVACCSPAAGVRAFRRRSSPMTA
jgi:hypothetical protein